MKAPTNRLVYNLASFLKIKMSSTRRSNSMQITDKVDIEKRLRKRGSDLSDIDIETII
jgi:hypothetical protein